MPARSPTNNITFAGAVLRAGLLAGSLDITSAFVDYYIATGKSPVRVLNYIASGILGDAAFSGGTGVAIAGLLLHFVIAFLFTIFFFWIHPRLFSRIPWWLAGVIYGLFAWCVMNLVVVPLSLTPKSPFNLGKAAKAATILIVMIGLPVAYLAHRFYAKRDDSNSVTA